jgi:hypothetical protein
VNVPPYLTQKNSCVWQVTANYTLEIDYTTTPARLRISGLRVNRPNGDVTGCSTDSRTVNVTQAITSAYPDVNMSFVLLSSSVATETATIKARGDGSVFAGELSIVYQADNGSGGTNSPVKIYAQAQGGAPAIKSPETATGVVGRLFVYQVDASLQDSIAVTNLPPGLTFEPSLSSIVGTPTAEGVFAVQLSASSSTGTTNKTLNLTINPAPPPGELSIISSTAAGGRAGVPFSFQVITSGANSAARFTATGLPEGLRLNPVTGLISGTPASFGSFGVALTVEQAGRTGAATLQLTFTADPAAPAIVSRAEGTLTAGQPFDYRIVVLSSDATIPITLELRGTLPAGLQFDAATGRIFGTPAVQGRLAGSGKPLTGGAITNNVQIFAGNKRGVSTIEYRFLERPRGVVNISTRVSVASAESVLIGGFIITGDKPKKVVLRAVGPSLTAGGAPLAGALQDPVLQLFQGSSEIGSNDNWSLVPDEREEINFSGVPPSHFRESAMVAFLNPGSYTAVVRGKNGGTGIGVVELYDAGNLKSDSREKLANISTRGLVQQGDKAMIGGFIVQDVASRVIVRALGPSLQAQGVAGALQDTTLDLRDANGSLVVRNDDWRSGGQEQQIIDTTVPPTDDRESAVVATLNPGPYTAVVRGKDNSTGVALVEAYVLQ